MEFLIEDSEDDLDALPAAGEAQAALPKLNALPLLPAERSSAPAARPFTSGKAPTAMPASSKSEPTIERYSQLKIKCEARGDNGLL
jgi:hypothetical protein